MHELNDLERRGRLYLSNKLNNDIAPFSAWLYSEIDSAGVTKNEIPQPDHAAIERVRRMLGEAIEGRHRRTPWYRF